MSVSGTDDFSWGIGKQADKASEIRNGKSEAAKRKLVPTDFVDVTVQEAMNDCLHVTTSAKLGSVSENGKKAKVGGDNDVDSGIEELFCSILFELKNGMPHPGEYDYSVDEELITLERSAYLI